MGQDNFNVIFEGEECYGFLYDLIKMFEHDAQEFGDDDETFKEAIEYAQELQKQEEEEGEYHIYKSWYNPMGAFIFTRLKEEE